MPVEQENDAAAQFREYAGIEKGHVDDLTSEDVEPEPDESDDTEPDESDDTSDPEDTEPEDDAYDPSEHTAAEVNEYLEEHPDESDAVIAAEREGKNRKTITGDA